MFGQRGLVPAGRSKRGQRQKRHRPVHHLKLLHQEPVVRGQVDLLVEPPVRSRQRRGIAQQFAVFLDHVAQHPDLFGGGMAGSKTRRQPLQLGPHDIQFGQLVVIQRRHDQRPPVPRQHALRLQPLQRLSDRGARHAKALGQLAFHKAVTRAIGPVVDRFEDQRIGVFLHLGGPLLRAGARASPCLILRLILRIAAP